MPLLKHQPQLRPQVQLFLWQYSSSDGKRDRLTSIIDYGKELAKHPKVLKGQLAVMAWLRWYFGASAEQPLKVVRNRYGIWVEVLEGSKQYQKGQFFKVSWSHTTDVAAILLWTGQCKHYKAAPHFACDVEPLERMFLPDTLARVLNEDETAIIRRYLLQDDYAIRFWAAKEALFKAGQSHKGLRNGATVEVLPTETDPGVATVHQFRRTQDAFKVNLNWYKINQFGIVTAFLHTMPVGEARYHDMPLFAASLKK